MAIAGVELMIERSESAAAWSPRYVGRWHSVVIVGKPTETNCAIAAAFRERGQRVWLAEADTTSCLGAGDVAVARLDALPACDGIEPGLWRLPDLERQGARLMNGPRALLAAHDKLATVLLLRGAGVQQPRTAHLREVSVPGFPPPYVVKPRFGSWGRD